MYELSIYIVFSHTRGISGSLSIVLNRAIPSTKIVEHTIINNKTYFMYQIVKDISKSSKYIEILFKAVCNFCSARGGGFEVFWGARGGLSPHGTPLDPPL